MWFLFFPMYSGRHIVAYITVSDREEIIHKHKVREEGKRSLIQSRSSRGRPYAFSSTVAEHHYFITWHKILFIEL